MNDTSQVGISTNNNNNNGNAAMDPRKDIEQSLKVLSQLDGLYKQMPDHERIQSIQKQREELINKCRQQQNRLKQLIHQMKAKNEQTRAQSVRVEPESEHLKRVKMLQRELEDLNESVFGLEQQCHNLSKLIEQEHQRQLSHQEQISSLDKEFNDQVRWGNDLTRMYKYVCPVEWDLAYSQGAKGFFKPDAVRQQNVILFDFTGFSERQTANRMWDKLYEMFC